MTPGAVLAQLEQLPSVTLLTGSGAMDLAQVLFDRTPRAEYSAVITQLSAENARHVVRRAALMTFSAEPRLFLICLDGATATAQNILLKVLEEPPRSARFILASERDPLPTVASRARASFALPAPGAAAPDPQLDRVRSVVGTAVRAARDGQASLLEAALRGWEPGHVQQLACWAAEAASGRYREFSPEFAAGVTAQQALAVLGVLTAFPKARTAASVALYRAFRGR